MLRNPMQSILAFAENRGKEADILTTRVSQLLEPFVAAMPEGQRDLPRGQTFVPPPAQSGPVPGDPQSYNMPTPPPSFSGVAGAGAGFTNVQLPDGTVQRREGTRAWRNNNPGNIEYGDFAASRGAVGSDGRFAVFPTYEAGREAKASLLFESPSYRDRTISSAINRYAPPSENDTRNYVGQVAGALGVSPDTRLSDLSPQQRETMLDAMQRVEGFTPGTVNGVQADDLYHTVGDALGVTLSSSGTTTPEERRTIESDLGAILNEVYDPESQVEANKRQGVADLFTGLGIGFGQMSRGDRVDLSEVRNAAAQRRREQTALRMERAKRAAGASYAMELGDEGLARAIAGGAADVNTLLTKRQQDIVNDRALRQEARQLESNQALADALADSDITMTDSMRRAIELNGADALTTQLSVKEKELALEAIDRKLAAEEDRINGNVIFADQLAERGDPKSVAMAQILRENPRLGLDEAAQRAELLAPSPRAPNTTTVAPGATVFDLDTNEPVFTAPRQGAGVDPAARETNLLGAQTALAAPNPPAATQAAARLVQESGGALSMADAQKQVTAGGAYAAPEGPSAEQRADNLLGAMTALRDEDAPEATRAAAQLVESTQGRISMQQATEQVTAGGAYADDPEMRIRDENIEANAAALQEAGAPPKLALDLATGLETGRYIRTTNPETGALALYDQTAMLLGKSQRDAQVFPPPAEPSNYDPPAIVPESADYSAAFGTEGVYKNTLNSVGEALGLGLMDRPNREAVTAVRRLAQNGKIAAAIEVGGRPSAFLLQLYESLETQPAQFFTGSETAEIQLEEQRAAVVRDLQELDQILVPNAPFTTATRENATLRRNAQLAHLADLDVVLNGIRRGQAQAYDGVAEPSDDGPSLDELLEQYGGE